MCPHFSFKFATRSIDKEIEQYVKERERERERERRLARDRETVRKREGKK